MDKKISAPIPRDRQAIGVKMEDQERSIQVLIMKREDCFAAVALSADIWGYGMTYEDALEDLEEHLTMQITYLKRSNKVELINRPAAAEFFEMYNECFIALVKDEPVPNWWIQKLAIPGETSDEPYVRIPARTTIASPSARYAASRCHRLAA